jgi:Flp pilus assembly protein TadG
MRNSQRGQALVEFAIILPVILALMLGGADLIMGFSARQNVNYVAEETARCLASSGATCAGGAGAYAQSLATGVGLANPQMLSASYSSCGSQCASVTVNYPFKPVFPFFPTNITLTSTAQAYAP